MKSLALAVAACFSLLIVKPAAAIPIVSEPAAVPGLFGTIAKVGGPVLAIIGLTADLVTLFTLDLGGPTPAPVLRLTLSGDRNLFDVVVQGNNITKDVHQSFDGTFGGSVTLQDGTLVPNVPFWKYTLDINLSQNVSQGDHLTDRLNIHGTIQHVIPGDPGDDPTSVGVLNFGFSDVDADSAPLTSGKGNLNAEIMPYGKTAHPPHHDEILQDTRLADVVFTNETFPFGSKRYDFTFLSLEAAAKHIPGPSTGLLVGTGGVVLLLFLWLRGRRHSLEGDCRHSAS